MCEEASQRYNLAPELIEHDYRLVNTLFAWVQAAGGSRLPRPYGPPWRSASAGRVVFAGGTALSAVWDVSPRWSEDIDLILDAPFGVSDKNLRASCKHNAVKTCSMLGASCHVVDQGPGHFFFESAQRDTGRRSRIDVSFRRLANLEPVWVATRPVFSLMGRIAEREALDCFPEMGGFAVPAVGPGLTMTDKLLAQTKVAESRDPDLIRERARDTYDLACIAKERSRFEGHIGRDTRYLLHVSEMHRPSDDPRRPTDGIASLRTFDSSTPEYEALAEGYETVSSRMVWGDKIPLDEAIRLAISLDEGPAEPFEPSPRP